MSEKKGITRDDVIFGRKPLDSGTFNEKLSLLSFSFSQEEEMVSKYES